MKKGREFEKFVADIERGLSNLHGIKVEHNVKLSDSKGCLRQIDVLVTDQRGRFPCITIIECKNTKAKVDINTVGAFRDLLTSVNAHHGIIVSASGFQSGAYQSVKNTNIHLYQLTDSADLEKHFKEYRFIIYELNHEPKDIIVGFNKVNKINENVTLRTPLFAPILDRPITIAEIAEDFLHNHRDMIANSLFRSTDDLFKAQTIVGTTEIHIAFPSPLIYVEENTLVEVAGFRAAIQTTLTTDPSKLHKVSTYTNVITAETNALVFELNIGKESFHWLEKYATKGYI